MHAVSAIQGDRTGTPSFLYFPFCFQVTDGVAQRDTVIEVSVAGDTTACSSLWIFEPSSGMETSPPKQNTVTVSALAKALGLLAHAWERKGQVRTCSVHSFAAWAQRQPPNSTASVKCVCVCVWVLSPPQLLTCSTGGTSSRRASCSGASCCCSSPWPSSAWWASWPTWPWPRSRPPSASASTSLFYKLCRKPTRATLSSECPSWTSPCPAPPGPPALWLCFSPWAFGWCISGNRQTSQSLLNALTFNS